MHNRQTSFTVLQCIQDGGIQAEEGVRIIHLSDKFGTVGKRKCEKEERSGSENLLEIVRIQGIKGMKGINGV